MWASVINTVGSPCSCHMDVSFSTSFPSCNDKSRKTDGFDPAQSTHTPTTEQTGGLEQLLFAVPYLTALKNLNMGIKDGKAARPLPLESCSAVQVSVTISPVPAP